MRPGAFPLGRAVGGRGLAGHVGGGGQRCGTACGPERLLLPHGHPLPRLLDLHPPRRSGQPRQIQVLSARPL